MNIALSIRRDYRHVVILTGLSVGLVVCFLFSLTVGAVFIPVSDVAIILLRKVGLFTHAEVDSMHEVVLHSIRFPRLVMTILIGGALGISGASLQGVFRNPLVEPGLIGVSGGSAAAVVIFIVFGSSILPLDSGLFYTSLLSFAAFAGGLAATFLVLQLSNQDGETNIAVLVLIGVAIIALTSALIGLTIFYADENQVLTYTFWTLGDLGGASWDKLVIAAPLLIFSSGVLLFFSPALNALALGEAEAYHVGVDVEHTKRLIILLSALAVGVSVSMAGMIGFIGLIVPHVIRIAFSSDHKVVLPASILGGALLLMIADLLARTVVRPAELPIGVVTALIGAPFFIGLLINAKRKRIL